MILIFSTAFNEGSTDDVIDWLKFYNVSVQRINGEDFLEKDFLDYKTSLLKDVKAVWYRRSFNFDWLRDDFLKGREKDFNKFGFVNTYSLFSLLSNEIKDYLESFYEEFYDRPWLSHYKNRHLNKPKVLQLAKESGLSVPEYIITNQKSELVNFKKKVGRVITKAISDAAIFDGKNSSIFLYTSKIGSTKDLSHSFFPSFFQEEIDKEFEIRVFFLNGIFYPMAIFSQASQKTETDFRNYDEDNPNRYVPYILPNSLEMQLKFLLEKTNLNCASIDLIKSTNGLIYFLEINPVGQFGFVSYSCNYQLENEIAKTLINFSNE